MRSSIVKRSIIIAGHKTSVSLEDAFWKGLKEIRTARKVNLSELVTEIDAQKQHGNLSSAIRLFVLDEARTLLAPNSEARDALHPLEPTAQQTNGHGG